MPGSVATLVAFAALAATAPAAFADAADEARMRLQEQREQLQEQREMREAQQERAKQMREQIETRQAGLPRDAAPPGVTDAAAPAEPAACGPGTVMRDGACEPEERGGGCLVATSAYGTELAAPVQELREIRDRAVMSTGAGSAFMAGFSHAYYAVSPQIADMERQSPEFRELVRAAIGPGIAILGAVMSPAHDSPSEWAVTAYGAMSLAALAGFYVGLPAAGAGAARTALARRRGTSA